MSKHLIHWSRAFIDGDYSETVDMSAEDLRIYIKKQLKDKHKRLIAIYHEED